MISVIVPFKDAGEWLPRCLESLANQLGDFQFVLVNDGSKDDSVEIAKKYSTDIRFVLTDNQYIPGVSGARNTGLELAIGDWITFLDADDYLDETAWLYYGRAIRSTARVVQFDHQRYYSEINKTVIKYTNLPGIYTAGRLPKSWPMVWNKLFRREILQGVRFRCGMQFGEDELFVLECLAKRNEIQCVKGVPVVHCFDNPGSLARIRTKGDLIKQQTELMKFLMKQEDPELVEAVMRIMSAHWTSKTYMKSFQCISV